MLARWAWSRLVGSGVAITMLRVRSTALRWTIAVLALVLVLAFGRLVPPL